MLFRSERHVQQVFRQVYRQAAAGASSENIRPEAIRGQGNDARCEPPRADSAADAGEAHGAFRPRDTDGARRRGPARCHPVSQPRRTRRRGAGAAGRVTFTYW